MAWSSSSYDSVTASLSGNETWTTPSGDTGLPLLSRYSVWYASYHGYVSLVVCAIGIVGNVFNVVVLTRPNMATSSTNCILTALAVSDLVTMIVYVPFAVQFYCRRSLASAADTPRFTPDHANTFGWTVFLLFYVHTSVTAHTVSIWLAVLLSVVRYAFVRPRTTATQIGGSGSYLGRVRVRCAIVGVYAFAVLILIPNYLSLVVRRSPTFDMNGKSPQCSRRRFRRSATCLSFCLFILRSSLIITTQARSSSMDDRHHHHYHHHHVIIIMQLIANEKSIEKIGIAIVLHYIYSDDTVKITGTVISVNSRHKHVRRLAVDEFSTYLTKLLDKHAPMRQARRKPRGLAPWFDGDCHVAKKTTRHLQQAYRRTRQPQCRDSWQQALAEYTALSCARRSSSTGTVVSLMLLTTHRVCGVH